MGCIGYQLAIGGEDGAGEVEPLTDVDGNGSLLQRPAHGLCDGHEAIREQR